MTNSAFLPSLSSPIPGNRARSWRRPWRVLRRLPLLGLLGAALALPAAAQPTQNAWSLHRAKGKTYKRVGLNWHSEALWTRRLGESGRVELSAELGLAWWRPDAGAPAGDMLQFSAVPLWRFWASPQSRLHVEIGIGPSLLSRRQFAGRNLSTHFQFADHIGLGYALDERSRLGLRYSHFSNAGIKRPNPGLDVLQITWTKGF